MKDVKKMWDKCDIRKWSEYEVRAKSLSKHEDARWINGEAYQNPVCISIRQ